MAAKQPSKETVALMEKKMDMSLDDIVRMSKTNTGKNMQQRVSNKSRGVFNGNQDRSLKMQQYMNSRSTLRQGVYAQKRSHFQGKSVPLPAEPARRTAVATFYNRPVNNRNAGNWNKPRVGGPSKYQGNAFSGGNSLMQQQPRHQPQHQRCQPQPQPQYQQHQPQHQQRQPQHQQRQHQHALPRGEPMPNKKPKTLDSLFANMKEQRMRSFNAHPNNGGNAHPNNGRSNARVGFTYNQPRQPWLRGRFVSYNN